jgi:polysaccharide pyruvyl transferase WcaK-like protein
MKPCVLLFGYYGRQNLGDEIMLTVLVERLRGLWPDCRIVATCHDDASRLSVLGIEKLSDFSAALAECDVLIVGGGSQFHDVGPWGWRGPWSILRVIRAARRRGKKVALLAVGFGPLVSLRGRLASWMSAWLADLVTVRDPASAVFLKQGRVPQRKVYVTADLAFLFGDRENLPLRTEVLDRIRALPRPRVGVNVFGHLDTNAVTTRHSRGPTADDVVRQRVFAEALDRVIEDTGGSVVFVAGQGAVDGHDYDEAERVRARMKRADRSINLGYDARLTPYFSILKELDALVAMKLHVLVLGYMVGLPILGIEYQSKIRDVLGYAGVEAIFDARALSTERLVYSLEALLEEKKCDRAKQVGWLAEQTQRSFPLLAKAIE